MVGDPGPQGPVHARLCGRDPGGSGLWGFGFCFLFSEMNRVWGGLYGEDMDFDCKGDGRHGRGDKI